MNAPRLPGDLWRPALVASSMSAAELGDRLAKGGLEFYSSCTGALCIRTIEEGNAHRAMVSAERRERTESARRHAESVRAEVRNLRIAQGLCIRDGQCLLEIEHGGACIHNVRDLAARRQLAQERRS